MISSSTKIDDFLQLSLANPHGMAPYSFQLGTHTKVSIVDSGVIVFEPLTILASKQDQNVTKTGSDDKVTNNKDIVLSSGIHGNETAPIELCNQLITLLLQQELIVQHRVMFIFGNLPAINYEKRFISQNMNRLFLSSASSFAKADDEVDDESCRARALCQYVGCFFGYRGNANRLHYDLHTAIRESHHDKFAIYPYRGNAPYSEEQIVLLASAGIYAILFHHEATTTFSYFSSSNFGAEAFTIELGRVQPMGKNDLTKLDQLKRVLTQLISKESVTIPNLDLNKLNLYQVSRSINKGAVDFSFNFAWNIKNFTSFKQGELLAQEQGREYKVEAAEETVVFPNAAVPVGQRALLCLTPVTTASLNLRVNRTLG